MSVENREMVLAIKMLPNNDADAETIGDYLKELLGAVWVEEESFSGKRPFGNSAWKYEVYAALIQAGVLKGQLDEFGCVEDCDEKTAETLMVELIDGLVLA